MGTIKQHFSPEVALLRSGTAFPGYVRIEGTTGPVSGYAFDATTEEAIFFVWRASNYGSGALTILTNWYADTGTSGGVAFGISLACITPNTDTQDIETKAFATETVFTDTHLGTTGQRDHDALGSISTNLDSLALDDRVCMKLVRKVSDAGDTMSGDMILTMVDISYSDT